MDEFDEGLAPATKVVEAKDVSKQRQGLFNHAFTVEGIHEPFEARLQVRIKPNTMARLKLFCDDYDTGYPLIDEVVDKALHEYLCGRLW
jgi:hypothetical protein